MLKTPKKTKFKSPHLHLCNKGLKGYKTAKQAVMIKTKQGHLMSPQQREVCQRILSKPVKEQYGTLNIKFFQNLSRSTLQTVSYRGQRTKTNAKTTKRLHKSGIFYIFPIRKIIKGFIKGRRKIKNVKA